MIVALLRKIEAHLAEIVRILRTPEDFTSEDATVRKMTEAVQEAKERIPSDQKGEN